MVDQAAKTATDVEGRVAAEATEDGHRLQSSAQKLGHAAVELAAKRSTRCRRPRTTWFTEPRKGQRWDRCRGEEHAQKTADKPNGQ